MDEQLAFISFLVNRHPTLSLEWGPGWSYKRARKLGVDECPSKVRDLIWKPDAPAAVGRANPAGFQVLYLADRFETAFSEICVEDDDVLLAQFSILPGRSIRLLPIGELTQIHRTGRGFLSGEFSNQLSNIIKAFKHDEAKSLLMADTFLLDCLISDDDDYVRCSYLAKCIFEKQQVVSAIVYPSVRQSGSLNLVVKKDQFWKNWGIHSARRGQVTHLACGYYSFTNTRHVTWIDSGGTLRWNDQLSDENTAVLFDPLWTLES
ncbi:MAG: RES family NAD+ phosphorylase [Nitrosospira sp.]